jgi:hypothetical protein
MSIEHAKETLEHAEHEAAHGDHSDSTPRRVAILVAFLAAALALAELSEKAAQNEYLTHHISLSDTYNFFQARVIRRDLADAAADTIQSLPTLDDEARKRIEVLRGNARAQETRPKTKDGIDELLERSKHETEERDHAFHKYHKFEIAVGALQISIVLASVSIVTRIKMVAYISGAIGLAAAVYVGLTAGGIA